jgi:hypothetical protein
MTWSEDDIQQLKELCKSMTIPHIAEKMGRTKDQIRWQIRKNCLKTRVPWARHRTDRTAMYKYSKQYGCKAAAQKFNVSVDTIKSLRQRHVATGKRNAHNLGEEALTATRKWAMRYAARKGRSVEDTKEFGSFAVIKHIEIGGPVSIRFMFMEWMSKEGRIRYDKCYDESETQDEVQRRERVSVAAKKIKRDDWIGLLEDIEGIDRAIFILYIKFGFRMKELAEIFGIALLNVSNTISKIGLKLRSKCERKDFDEN